MITVYEPAGRVRIVLAGHTWRVVELGVTAQDSAAGDRPAEYAAQPDRIGGYVREVRVPSRSGPRPAPVLNQHEFSPNCTPTGRCRIGEFRECARHLRRLDAVRVNRCYALNGHGIRHEIRPIAAAR